MLSLALLGFIPIALSMCINFVARRDLARFWSPLASPEREQKLIKTGIYAKLRHPIYLSFLILLLGVAMIGGNLWSLLFFVLLLIVLEIRIRKEERELIAKFGKEYKNYAKETPRIMPKLRRK
jgi:protein-S-isoprenylcysteine O-methyltransferase Ste14